MWSYRTLLIVFSVLMGMAIGIGSYTFIYAKGGSYLTNDPAACANCHIMNEQYAGWIKSSHRSVNFSRLGQTALRNIKTQGK